MCTYADVNGVSDVLDYSIHMSNYIRMYLC